MLLYFAAMAEKLIHEVIPVGMLQCNCSILGDPVTREAIVVDPGDDVESILEILRKHDLKVRAIVSTHTHIDHVGGLAGLHRATRAPVLIHHDDLELYKHLDVQAGWLGVPTPATANIDEYLKEGDVVRWGPFEASVLHTPGHTPGSISLYFDSRPSEAKPAAAAAAETHRQGREAEQPVLLAGDTLFQASIGRTDLWGGSLEKILDSIHQKLLVLPDETIVYPGHGPETTIGFERENNPFLR
ncbi:MAG TPA: MBL fold metallo-hydrolase [archaeon]|nr:MBL fold metallo-hydrolase [archaeon]